MRKMTIQQIAPLLILSMIAIAVATLSLATSFSDSTKYSDFAWMIVAIPPVFLLIPGPGIFLWRIDTPFDKKYGHSIERRIHRKIEKGTAYMA